MAKDWTHNQLHPCLKPHDWKGAEHAAAHPLLATEDPVPEMPWVALCRDLPDQIIFPPKEELNEMQLLQVANVSMGNLGRSKVSWSLQQAADSPLLVGKGDFASEQILNPELPALAMKRLGCERFAAACPRRGILLMRPLEGPGLKAFQTWVAHLYYAEVHFKVMPFCVVIGQGGIQSVLRDPGALAVGRDRAASAGAKRLVQVVGYHKASQTLLLSCAPTPGQGLPPGDISWLQQVVDEGYQDRPVLQMRMTLPSEGMARMIASHLEALPIDLDFIGPDGKLAPLAN